jgi:hypothetical protein
MPRTTRGRAMSRVNLLPCAFAPTVNEREEVLGHTVTFLQRALPTSPKSSSTGANQAVGLAS